MEFVLGSDPKTGRQTASQVNFASHKSLESSLGSAGCMGLVVCDPYQHLKPTTRNMCFYPQNTDGCGCAVLCFYMAACQTV